MGPDVHGKQEARVRRSFLILPIVAAAAVLIAFQARVESARLVRAKAAAPTVRALLAEYWGEDWPSIEGQYETHVLEQTVDPSTLTDWSIVKNGIHERLLKFVADERSQWVHRMSGLDLTASLDLGDPSDVSSEDPASRLRREILETSELAFEALMDADAEIVSAGAYQLDYLVARPVPRSQPRADEVSTTRIWSEYPWFISYTILSGEVPELRQHLSTIHEKHVELHRVEHHGEGCDGCGIDADGKEAR